MSYNREIPAFRAFLSESRDFLGSCLFVECWIGEVNVLLVHTLLCQSNRFAETLEVNHFPLPKEADHIVDVRIVGETKNIIIGKAGFLLWYDN